jgi:hypothetical protein
MTNVRSAIVGFIVLILLVTAGIYVYQKSIKTIADRNASTLSSPSPAEKFKALSSPTPVASPTNKTTNVAITPSTGVDPQNVGITVNSPQIQNKVMSPVTIKGSANVLDSTVNLRILDANGDVLGTSQTTACMAQDACPFSATFNFSASSTPTGIIQTFGNPTSDNPVPYLQSIEVSF